MELETTENTESTVEAVQPEITNEAVSTEVVTEIPQGSEEEDKARQGGWVPKEEFKGDPDLWKSAKQFNDYGQLLDVTHQQKRKIQKLVETTEDLLRSMHSIKDRSYQEALHTIKAQRAEAISIGDQDTAEKLFQAEKNLIPPAPINQTPPEMIEQGVKFGQENKWLKNPNDALCTDIERRMSTYAYEREKQMLTEGLEYGNILSTIKEEVQKGFPDYFRNFQSPQNTVVPSVTPRSTVSRSSSKLSISDLPPDERERVQFIKRTVKSFDFDQYLIDTRGSTNK